ncbi:MAG: ATP-binding cassette domain-containing protein, partial [Pseudomonadota bacterium]
FDLAVGNIEAQRHLGYLPEGAPAYGDMTVAGFMTFVARMRGLSGPKLNDRLAEMVARVHLRDVWNKPIDALSKGFKRRVGIAQALVHDPDVLILDEPTDGLDPNQKHEMRALISEIAPDKAIIVSTHILEEVEAICTRAVIIARGRVVADETPKALLKRGRTRQELRVRITKRAPADNIIETIAPHLPGSEIQLVEDNADQAELAVRLGQGRISTADFTSTLARDGLIVTEIAEAAPQLDDVFREITQDRTPS